MDKHKDFKRMGNMATYFQDLSNRTIHIASSSKPYYRSVIRFFSFVPIALHNKFIKGFSPSLFLDGVCITLFNKSEVPLFAHQLIFTAVDSFSGPCTLRGYE